MRSRGYRSSPSGRGSLKVVQSAASSKIRGRALPRSVRRARGGGDGMRRRSVVGYVDTWSAGGRIRFFVSVAGFWLQAIGFVHGPLEGCDDEGAGYWQRRQGTCIGLATGGFAACRRPVRGAGQCRHGGGGDECAYQRLGYRRSAEIRQGQEDRPDGGRRGRSAGAGAGRRVHQGRAQGVRTLCGGGAAGGGQGVCQGVDAATRDSDGGQPDVYRLWSGARRDTWRRTMCRWW